MAAPTGTYEYYMGHVTSNSVPVFTLHLYTNGTYLGRQIERAVPTQDGDLFRLLPRTNTARGTWHWDAEKREFRFEPGDFIFYIKTLPADKHNTNRLVWGRGFLVRKENE